MKFLTYPQIVSNLITKNRIEDENRKGMDAMAKNARNLLKESTWELVLKQGFKATKVQDICADAGVSKMTFYYYYKNKYDIIEEVLTDFFENSINISKEIMAKEVPFKDKMMELVHWKAKFVKLMSPKFVEELYLSGGRYMEIAKKVISDVQNMTRQFYLEGKAKGEINRTVDVEVIISWMNLVSDMIVNGQFNHLFEDPKEMNRQIRDLILYGVLGNVNEVDYHDLTMF